MRARERQIGAKVNEKARIGTVMIKQTTFVKGVPRNSKLKTPTKTSDTRKNKSTKDLFKVIEKINNFIDVVII